MPYKTFRDLVVWQKAMDLVVEIYRLTGGFPAEEKFGLTSQMRRAAVSIPCNIAEGHGRHSGKEFLRFLWIANGSLTELETQLIITHRLQLITKEDYQQLREHFQQVGRMLTGLRTSLEQPSPNQTTDQPIN